MVRLSCYGKTLSHKILERLMFWNAAVKQRKYLETPDCE